MEPEPPASSRLARAVAAWFCPEGRGAPLPGPPAPPASGKKRATGSATDGRLTPESLTSHSPVGPDRLKAPPPPFAYSLSMGLWVWLLERRGQGMGLLHPRGCSLLGGPCCALGLRRKGRNGHSFLDVGWEQHGESLLSFPNTLGPVGDGSQNLPKGKATPEQSDRTEDSHPCPARVLPSDSLVQTRSPDNVCWMP